MKALILEERLKLSLRNIDIDEETGPDDVKIRVERVGICGSDVHYYTNGKIGNFIVREPMVLGHEASGTIIETGKNVRDLKNGDRVCMEPGIPDMSSQASMKGLYNLDPSVKFWATPPVHGCLRETVVHPAKFVFRLPEKVTFDEGAMAEPLSVGLQAATKAGIKPGDTALVTGCGTIGLVTAMAAKAGGCSTVIISDIVQEKLDTAARLGFIPVNVTKENLSSVVHAITGGWGADIIFEASGNAGVMPALFEPLCPGGTIVFIGMPVEPVAIDIVAAQAKEAVMKTIFRYAHVYPKAVNLMASGDIDVKPLVTDHFSFDKAVEAFEYAAHPRPSSVKVMIDMD